jgi:uncharacterized protein
VMRLLATLPHYLATAGDDGIQVHQYADATLHAGDRTVRVRTDCPWGGRVEVEILESGSEPWTLALRVPAWAAGARLDAEAVAAGDYARLRREWRPGEKVVLELPMTPRLIAPHPRIDAVRGCLAIERGPLVYCLEAADAPAGASIDDLLLDPRGPLEDAPRPDLLGGIVGVSVSGRHRVPEGWDTWPYAPHDGTQGRGDGPCVSVLAVPYALWGNRGPGAMRVWTPALR